MGKNQQITQFKKSKNKRKNLKLSGIRPRKLRLQHWSCFQQRIYLEYLKTNIQIMRSQRLRRERKVFRQISGLIKTRSSIQVKSHHQKLQNRFTDIEIIIKNLEKYLLECEKSENNIILNSRLIQQKQIERQSLYNGRSSYIQQPIFYKQNLDEESLFHRITNLFFSEQELF